MSFIEKRNVRVIALMVRVVALVAFVLLTNGGFVQRLALLQNQGRWITLVGFIGVWALSAVALAIAAFDRRLWVRGGWAILIAVSTAVGLAYHQASGSDFGILDAVSLWSARHEATRAMEFYSTEVMTFALAVACAFFVLTIPPTIRFKPVRRWVGRLAWLPALPIALIAGITVAKEGGGTEALPTQFAPLSVGLVSATKLARETVPKRHAVAWTPGRREIKHVVMLVDESLRGDYIDWTPGNPYTPEIARLKSRFVNFGPAASGGNCSHYSNALLRFMAARDHLGPSILSNPTVWQYAKRAGFRTVFIDAQSAFNRNPSKLQNFMTASETRDIDRLVMMPETEPAPQLDDRLLDAVIAELRSPDPVFIYANKNGAHFPYDNDYPPSARLFHPTMTDAMNDAADKIAPDADGASPTRINSYRNAVRWSVDRFMERLFDEADLNDTVILYTSDHGQAFNPHRFTHCTVDDPDPREGLVPLMVSTTDPGLQQRFAAGAAASRGHASHFALAPTLLELFGYARSDIDTVYGPSLFEPETRPTGFTSGDIFGLFSSTVRWHPLDLRKNYLEPAAIVAEPQPNFTERRAAPAARAAGG